MGRENYTRVQTHDVGIEKDRYEDVVRRMIF
jgi:hypothetical protein